MDGLTTSGDWTTTPPQELLRETTGPEFWAQCNRAVTTLGWGAAGKGGMTKPRAIRGWDFISQRSTQAAAYASGLRRRSRKAANNQERMPISNV